MYLPCMVALHSPRIQCVTLLVKFQVPHLLVHEVDALLQLEKEFHDSVDGAAS